MMLKTIAFAAALGLTAAAHAAPPAPQATTPAAAKGMNYDCTKAGNKNKAACKNVTQGGVAATPAAKPAAPAKTTMAMSATPAKPMAPATAKPATAAKPMNYDCTKAGNANKQACKNVVVPPAGTTAAKPAAAAMPIAPARTAATVSQTRTATGAGARTNGPNEVTATLKNGKTVHYDCSKTGNKDKKACGAAAK